MKNHLKTYIITLETLGPLFIGSGTSIGKKESIFQMREKKVYVPNMILMYKWLIKNGMQKKYEEFILSYYNDFGKWLNDNDITKEVYMPWISYALDATDADLDTKEKKEILCFVKDSYGKPYIPGSSLKGAIRTILLGDNIINHNGKYVGVGQDVKKAEFKNRKGYLAREFQQLEQKVFRTRALPDTKPNDATNDILVGVRIGDSQPLSCEDLILCKKLDINPKGVEKKLNVLRECVKPKTKIYFDLTIDTTIIELEPKDILKAVGSFLNHYNKSFDNRFESKDNYIGNMIYLGGGSGFVSKTVIYPLLGTEAVGTVSKVIDATLGMKAKKEHNHKNDISLGVSPHMIKKTIYKNKKVSFGSCKINIEERK